MIITKWFQKESMDHFDFWQKKTHRKKSQNNIGVKVLKNRPSKIYGRQPLNNLKWHGLPKQTISLQIFKGYLPQIFVDPFLNTLTHIWRVQSEMPRQVKFCLCTWEEAIGCLIVWLILSNRIILELQMKAIFFLFLTQFVYVKLPS